LIQITSSIPLDLRRFTLKSIPLQLLISSEVAILKEKNFQLNNFSSPLVRVPSFSLEGMHLSKTLETPSSVKEATITDHPRCMSLGIKIHSSISLSQPSPIVLEIRNIHEYMQQKQLSKKKGQLCRQIV